MIHVVYVVIYLRMLFIFFLNVHFIDTIELLCLTILITLFPSLLNIYSLDVMKLLISEEFNTLLFKSVQKFIRQTCRFNN